MIRFVLIVSFIFTLISAEICHLCGYNCDANCNCGKCNNKPGCSTKEECLGPCNSGGNAKWCAGISPTPPTPVTPVCHGCGYNCNDNCVCGHCNTKPGCMSKDTCLGPCDSGGNAKWCGGGAPTPAPPPTPSPHPPPYVVWTTKDNVLQRNGTNVVLHGLGTTCTEYLLRGIGMKCWATYNWPTPSAIFSLNEDELGAIIPILKQAASSSVVPAVRIPMTGSSWLGVETEASKANMAKYPKLGDQYQGLIAALVKQYTSEGIVVILDLHWNDDDTENAGMAAKGNSSAIKFWDSVSAMFSKNTMVFYELYNEPHLHNVTQWMNGDATTAGMLEMLAAVRKNDLAGVVLIAGATSYAYNADSLVQIDSSIPATSNVMWSFHPYMGPNQAGDPTKCPSGFESLILKVNGATKRPSIITEFGQQCCPTSAGVCEHCPSDTLGYDEHIITIAQNYSLSWLPWAWRPAAGGPNTKTCQDLNGGTDPAGLSLAHPTDGKGGDFATLWSKYGPKGL